MNNKLITYEEAKQRLKILEYSQKRDKRMLKNGNLLIEVRPTVQMRKNNRTERINMLLSIIHAHKQARKYYGKMKKLYTAVKNERQA